MGAPESPRAEGRGSWVADRATDTMTDAALWQSRLPVEVAYWDAWLGSKGLAWATDPVAAAEEFRARFDPTTPLQENLRNIIDYPLGSHMKIGTPVRILDVGAGPATVLGSRWPAHPVWITAIDPLAEQYWPLMQREGLWPPVHTVKGDGEDICDFWPNDTFDLAYARNSLDHGYNPMQAIAGMVQVVKPGCCVYLLHHIREADTQQRSGLHQWNLWVERGDYVAENTAGEYVNLTASLSSVATATIRQIGNDVEVILRKL